MLEELHVRDLALIEDVWLEFGPGMTVLTGETGAGKTALVGALKLLVGERADSTMVRAGSAEAVVEGRVALEDREIVARRRVTADGRSKCTLDGEMATVGALTLVLGPVIDLHGQHEHQALLQPARHAEYLDRYCGADGQTALDEYRRDRTEFAAAAAALEAIRARLADARQRAEYLRFVVSEIEATAPSVEEEAEIEARLPALKYGERLAASAGEAYAALRDEAGAADALGMAQTALRGSADLDPALDELATRLVDISALAEELASDLRAYRDSVEHDPEALDAALHRLSALGALKKKYGPDTADVLLTLAESKDTLAALDSGEQGLTEAESRVSLARDALVRSAERLMRLRHDAVPRFVSDLSSATRDLEMAGTSFDVLLEELPFDSWGDEGPQRVEFMYSPGTDQPAKPLARIASGGEISRVMLALKGVLGSADDVPVLVFDEVDSGIGGLTATAVGRRLKELADRHQVLVVTHLAQVAAFADHHIVVEKSADDEGVRTSVRSVAGPERTIEIARMLSGGETEAGIAHAEELLGMARSV